MLDSGEITERPVRQIDAIFESLENRQTDDACINSATDLPDGPEVSLKYFEPFVISVGVG
jgi:hypothetical protein